MAYKKNKMELENASQLDLEPFWQLVSFNGRTAVVVRPTHFEGIDLVDIRKMFIARDSETGDFVQNPENGKYKLLFTKKGISIRREDLKNLISELKKVSQIYIRS